MRIRLTRWSRCKGLLLAALAVAVAAFPSVAAADVQAQDTATASGDNLVLDDFSALNIHVDAHSGPLGENPGGSASFNAGGLLDISGPVDCLHVIGNVATLTIAGPFANAPYDGFIIRLVDNGGGGNDQLPVLPDLRRRSRADRLPERLPDLFRWAADRPCDGLRRPLAATVGDLSRVRRPGRAASRAPPRWIAAFDHSMNKSSAEAAFSLRRSNGELVKGSFGWYGNALIFAPDAPLAGGAGYTATVGAGAEDIVGNHLQSARAWQFTTAPQPLVAAVVPAENAGEVLPNANLVVAFDKAIDSSAQAAFSLKRGSDGAPVSGSFGWYGNALIFDPGADLTGGSRYTATVSTVARDLSGHPLAEPRRAGTCRRHQPPDRRSGPSLPMG